MGQTEPNLQFFADFAGARLRGRTTTQRSKKGSQTVLGRALGRVLRRGSAMGFTVKRVLRRVLRRGSEKAVCRRCLERGEYHSNFLDYTTPFYFWGINSGNDYTAD